MFKGLFGSTSKPKKVEQQSSKVAQPAPISQIDIDFEARIKDVNEREKEFEERIYALTEQMGTVRAEAKKFIKQKNEKYAKQKVNQISMLEKRITNLENQRQVFSKVKLQLESGQSNKIAATTLKKAVETLKVVQPTELEGILDDLQDMEQNSEEMAVMFNELANADQNADENEELYKQMEQEIQEEEANGLKQKLNDIPTAKTNLSSSKNTVQQKNNQFDSAMFEQLEI